MRVTEQSQLLRINDLIHDFWFDYDEEDPESSGVKLDPTEELLEIEYRWEDWSNPRRDSGGFLRSTLLIPSFRGFLRVFHVGEAQIHDRAQIGGSTFNVIEFEPSTSTVRIKTNIPIEISVVVSRLEVEVEITDESTGEVTAKEYLGGLIQSGPN